MSGEPDELTKRDPALLHARKEIAAALKFFRAEYRSQGETDWRLRVCLAEQVMHRALDDCQRIDDAARRARRACCAVATFEVNKLPALQSIDAVVLSTIKARKGGETPRFKALKKGSFEVAKEKYLLEKIREGLRDQYHEVGEGERPANAVESAVLKAFASEIAEMSTRPSFAAGYARLLRSHRERPFRRSLPSWIWRAWIPLRLWECAADGQQAFERCMAAAKTLNIDLGSENEHQFFHYFLTAWRSVRSVRRVRKVKKVV